MTATVHDLARFGRRYRRFLRLSQVAFHVLPPIWRLAGARAMGLYASPYRERASILTQAMADALGLSPAQTRRAWRDWLENHGLAAMTVFAYDGLAGGWLGGLIRVADPDVLASLAESHGLVLTGHCQHQNLIAAYLGRACGNMHPLAAAAAKSPLYPWIGNFIERINRDSARWFGRGRYLFIEQRHASVRAMHAALAGGESVLALCDTHVPNGTAGASGRIFGRAFTPPLGAIRTALQLGVPIHAALMTPDARGLTLHLASLSVEDGLDGIVAGYCAFLESRLRPHPEAWQGWEWWSALPLPA